MSDTCTTAELRVESGGNDSPQSAPGPRHGPGRRGSILFVHGAGHGAWCWNEHFTEWFERRGYHVTAPDLPCHGEQDRTGVKKIPLDTYIATIAAEAAMLEPPVILIGHSMGGFIIQKYLESNQADLAVLLASVPPSGVGGMMRRMATHRPLAFLHTMLTGEATKNARVTRDYFFSPDTADRVVDATHQRLQQESSQVLKDMMKALHPERVLSPVVVIGAEHDWLVAPPRELTATAHAFGTLPITMPAGHDMMLDFAWEQVAAEVERAITARLPATADAQ